MTNSTTVPAARGGRVGFVDLGTLDRGMIARGSPMKNDVSREAREQRWRDWMSAAQAGEARAYRALLTEITPLLRQIVRRRWGDANDIDDIVQEILISIHTVRHTYDPARPFMPWLATIARRRIVDTVRSSSNRRAHETTVERMPDPPEEAAGIEGRETGDDLESLDEALAALSNDQRRAFELVKVKGLSHREASAETGKSIASIKVALHRALKSLRKRMREPE